MGENPSTFLRMNLQNFILSLSKTNGFVLFCGGLALSLSAILNRKGCYVEDIVDFLFYYFCDSVFVAGGASVFVWKSVAAEKFVATKKGYIFVIAYDSITLPEAEGDL